MFQFRIARIALAVALALGSTAFASPSPTPTERARPAWLGFLYTFQRGGSENTRPWLLVRSVVSGGPAERSGLRPQDVIEEIDGKTLPFRSDSEVLDYFATLHPKDERILTIRRGQERLKIRLTAAEMPDRYVNRWKLNREIAKSKR